uniref:C-type lectin n=1 Tax=Phalotris mertensi TaxID=1260334 RepID=A0A182C5T0_9SAUR
MWRFTFLSLSLMVVALSLSGAKSCCPFNWLVGKEFCYKLFDGPKIWIDAEMFCRKYKPGCHLASICNSEESADLAEYVSDHLTNKIDVWIGLNKLQHKGTWDWTGRCRSDYVAWMKNQPDNFKNIENCGELDVTTNYLQWNDQQCNKKSPFICQCKF